MRGSCALSFACRKSYFCLLSRAQNSRGVQLTPVALEVGGNLSVSFVRPQAAFLNNGASLHLAQRVKALATSVSRQVDAGSRFLQQIEKLEMNWGNKEREPEGASRVACLPAACHTAGQRG